MDSNNVGEMYMEEKNGKKKPGTKKPLQQKRKWAVFNRDYL